MRIREMLFIIKRKILLDRNLLFIFILSFFLCIVLVCSTIVYVFSYYNRYTANSILGRTLYVYGINEKDFSKYENIELYDSKKYSDGIEGKVKQLNSNDKDGIIFLKPIINKKTINLVNGEMPGYNEIICSERFYPYSLYDENFNTSLNDKLIINGNSLISKSFNINVFGIEGKVKVVGTFKNIPMDDINTCYTNKETFDIYASDIEFYSDGVPHYYDSYMVIVDKNSNVEKVEKQLIKDGYSAIKSYEYDMDSVTYFTMIPIVIAVISLIIVLYVIGIYFIKKYKSEKKNIFLFNALGYDAGEILKISNVESFIIYTIGFIISLFLLFLIIILFKNTLLVEMYYSNCYVKIPIIMFVIVYVFVYIYIMIINRLILRKAFNKSAYNLIKEGK